MQKIINGFWSLVASFALKRLLKVEKRREDSNYAQFTIRLFTPEGKLKKGNVTLQFNDGRTPAELRHEAEDVIKDMYKLIASVKAGEITPENAAAKAYELVHFGNERCRLQYRPTIDALQEDAFCNALEKGWHDKPRTDGEMIALMHSELSEALEELRNGKPVDEIYYNPEKPDKPEGVPIELADVVIRIFDFCGLHKINLLNAIVTKMVYNKTRPYRHGSKTL